jgi:zinc protease
LNYTHALQILDEVIAGGQTGKLYRKLVVERGMAAGISVSYDLDARYQAVFAIAAVPKPGVVVEDLERAIHEEIEGLLKNGVSVRDVEVAKKRLMRAAIFARDGLAMPGYVLGESLAIGLKIEDVETWPDKIAAVTPEKVNEALRAVLGQKGFVTSILLPETSNAVTAPVVPEPVPPAELVR